MRWILRNGRPVLVDENLVAAVDPPETMHWSGVIAVEGRVPTGDGRAINDGALTWETPFPLTYDAEHGGHGGPVVGTVWEVERRDDGTIWATGTFDVESDRGREAARQAARALTDGASIEPDRYDVEIRVREEVIAEWEEAMEAADENEVDTASDDVDEDGRVLLDEFRHDDFLEVVTSGRIRTLAQVITPAFDETRIELLVSLEDLLGEPAPTEDEPAAVAASAAPSDLFADPGLDGPTPLTIDDDGRVYGHLATWGTCHVGRDDVCLEPPRSESGYAYFATGETRCSSCDGDVSIPVGTITMDTGHASLSAGHRSAASHYDNTGTVVADVAAGEDAYGIWVAGRVRPEVLDDPDRLAALRASSLSGDWRRIGGSLELIAALAVNVPGFPIPRSVAASGAAEVDVDPRTEFDGDRQVALVASGMVVHPSRSTATAELDDETRETLRRIDRFVARQEAAAADEARARLVESRDAVDGYRSRRAEAARSRVRSG